MNKWMLFLASFTMLANSTVSFAMEEEEDFGCSPMSDFGDPHKRERNARRQKSSDGIRKTKSSFNKWEYRRASSLVERTLTSEDFRPGDLESIWDNPNERARRALLAASAFYKDKDHPLTSDEYCVEESENGFDNQAALAKKIQKEISALYKDPEHLFNFDRINRYNVHFDHIDNTGQTTGKLEAIIGNAWSHGTNTYFDLFIADGTFSGHAFVSLPHEALTDHGRMWLCQLCRWKELSQEKQISQDMEPTEGEPIVNLWDSECSSSEKARTLSTGLSDLLW
jgi:hypothetical protein